MLAWRGRPAVARAIRVALWSWAALCFAMGGSLMLGHSFALPRPASDHPELRAAVARTRRGDEAGRWLALHVLYARCRCSERVLSHLWARRALPDWAERIVLVQADASPRGRSDAEARAGASERGDLEAGAGVRALADVEARAGAAGFALEVISPEQLAQRYRLEAAPVLVIADPSGEIRYLGGYTERKQGYENRDLAILDAVRRGQRASELPLFGCAVSRALKQTFDPLGLRERR